MSWQAFLKVIYFFFIVCVNILQEPGSPVTSKKKKNKDKSPEEKYAGCKIEIINMDDRDLEIDFIGFHISLVNAYRRIVLAEVSCFYDITLFRCRQIL